MLRDTLARLASDFASQVFVALRSASIEELAELARPSSPKTSTAKLAAAAPKLAAAPKVAAAPKLAAAPRKVAKKNAPVANVAPPPDRALTSAALEFFAERGSKGATAAQLSDHLQSDAGSDVVSTLASSGFIRDAGIRRATGKGTAAVYVLSA